jgi:replicative DNA helicase
MASTGQSTKQDDRYRPPQDIDTEQAVLGAVLKDAEAIHSVIDVLDDESYFYSPRHSTIYRCIRGLYERSQPCDYTTVSSALADMGELEKIGGRAYLVELVEGVVSAARVADHARIILDKALLRQLIDTSNEIVKSAYSSDGTVEDLLDTAESNVFRISESRLRHGFDTMSHLVSESIQEIERIQAGDYSHDVMTGFAEIDTLTQGMHKGDFIVIAGRPSMGKSALAVNIAENVAIMQKKAVALFSIEMSKEQLVLRMLCGQAKVTQQRIRSRNLSATEWNNLTGAANKLTPAKIFIDDSAALTSLQMRAKARRLKAQNPDLGLIVVDYIQMMHAAGRSENRQQELSVISRNMKVIAKELEVPVIACSQLSRMVEMRGGDKRPQLADLRESGAIEQDADVVMFVYRPEYYLNADERKDQKNEDKLGVAEVIIAKQRNGPTGVANLKFFKEYATFRDLDKGHRDIPPGADPVGGEMPPF